MKYDFEKMKQATTLFIEAIGDDPKREGLLETPERVAKMYQILLGGYDIENEEHVKLFTAESQDMVTLHNVPIYSFCEHHIVLFVGRLHVAYIPNKTVIGVSKIVRIARTHTKKLQIQERLVKEIADDLERLLKPQGVAVQIQAQHFCMALRGVRANDSIMTTTAVRGLFKEDPKARSEFLDTIKREAGVYGY